MCGVFGYVQTEQISTNEVLDCSRLLRHRGPDDEGFLISTSKALTVWGGPSTPASVYERGDKFAPKTILPSNETFEPGLVLGHRRLSILDLSPAGHQPMNYLNRYWMVYNGEVYNFIELRDELQKIGYTFRSGSDSEVIMAAYAEWGAACLPRFNGMWSIAIFDRQAGTLFLARDRFGVKPLYYWRSAKRFAFASEIKAFSAFPEWAPKANMPRLLDFIVWNVSDHTTETMFSDVMQMPAGCYATLDVSDTSVIPNDIDVKSFYEFTANAQLTGAAAEEALRSILEDAVRLRLRADVPVGSCLSGGLDSSSIVSIMARQLQNSAPGNQVITFTARSEHKTFDEGDYASLVVAASHTKPRTVIPATEKLAQEFDQLIWHQDEPFVSTSIFAQWCVFALARENGITVMLDGQGADETLGGYRGFFGAYLGGLARRGRVLRWLREVRAIRKNVGFSLIRSLGYTLVYCFPKLASLIGRFDNRAYGELGWIAPSLRDRARSDPLEIAGARASSVRQMSIAQIKSTNLPMLLRWEDRNSMAFSIEARVPFLDYRLVELAIGIDEQDKVGGGIAKGVLRNAMRGIVPDAILDRKDKMGFVTAEPEWIKGQGSAWFRDMLVEAITSLPNVFDQSLLDQYEEVIRGERSFDHRYWRAIVTGRWARTFKVRIA